MPAKPIVVYIEPAGGGFRYNSARDARIYLFKEECGCEVELYDDAEELRQWTGRLRRNADFGRLAAIIVKQSEFYDNYTEMIEVVRKDVSLVVPLIVIPLFYSEKKYIGNKRERALRVYSIENDRLLLRFVRRLARGWQPPLDWLGAETPRDRSILMHDLETAYRVGHFGETELEMAALPDWNDQIVLQALRIKLLPPELIKSEFDDALFLEEEQLVKPSRRLFLSETEVIRRMSVEERDIFVEKLMEERGEKRRSKGGYYASSNGCGPNVRGFAIDPITLEYVVTQGRGQHHLALERLAARMQWIAVSSLKKGEERESGERELQRRLWPGLIHLKVVGLQTPILQLFLNPKDQKVGKQDLDKVAFFLAKEGRFIAVDQEGCLI